MKNFSWPRAMYYNNGLHFKGAFSIRLTEKRVKQIWASVFHSLLVGLVERYI